MLQQSDDGALRILTPDRPDKRSAWNLSLLKALGEAPAKAAAKREPAFKGA